MQIEYLQQANRDLEKRVEELLENRQNVTSEVLCLSTKNEELCKELSEIDQMAQQLERDKEMALESADAEVEEAKVGCIIGYRKSCKLIQTYTLSKFRQGLCFVKPLTPADPASFLTEERWHMQDPLGQASSSFHKGLPWRAELS